MGADALASIRSALRELAEAVEKTEEGAEEEPLLTLNIHGQEDRQWVQVLAGTLNMAWPRATQPDEATLAPLGLPTGALMLEDWKPRGYATFAFEDLPLEDLAQAIDRLFPALFGVAADYAVDVELSRI